MKKIIAHALMVSVVLVGVNPAVAGYSHHNHYDYYIHKGNYLRAKSDKMNYRASKLEEIIRHAKTHGEDTSYMESKAHYLRKKAKYLALKSNKVAKKAFDNGYIRGQEHSHKGHHHHNGHGHSH